MQDDEFIIFGHHQILFHIISALRICHRFGRQGMLRQIPAGAAVCNHNLIVCRKSGRAAEHGTREGTDKIKLTGYIHLSVSA